MMSDAPQVEWEFREPADCEAADDDALLGALARLLWERAKKRRESTTQIMEDRNAVAG